MIKSGSHLKQVIDEAYNNAKNCKMTMMPPFTFGKNINEEKYMKKLLVTLHSIMDDHNGSQSCKAITRKEVYKISFLRTYLFHFFYLPLTFPHTYHLSLSPFSCPIFPFFHC